ncbi:RtcB family protein [archaeon]|nr:RtcB family protein [archaeon]
MEKNKGYIEGEIKAENLYTNDRIMVYPYKGVEYEEPTDDIVLDRKNIEDALDQLGIKNDGNARIQIFKFLDKLEILPIRYNSAKLPILLKLMGFIFGDGVISFVNKRTGFIHFYGKREDLEEIAIDLMELGIPSKINERQRKHKIVTYYDEIKFDFVENSIIKKSTALSALFMALGMPFGSKTSKEYHIPKWIFNCRLWQKRLFLAAFFGAELSKPATLNKYNFYSPQLNMNKLESLVHNGIDFLNEIRLLLSEFEISTAQPVKVSGYQYNGAYGKTTGLRLLIHGNPRNLLNLYEKINFEYNKEKKTEACLAISYIRLKNFIKDKRKFIRESAKNLYDNGISINEIRPLFTAEFTPEQFINHSVWTKFKSSPRIAFAFMSFEEFKNQYRIGSNGIVAEKIAEIKKIPYNGYVYDVTMNDSNHNFIADSIVSHNCGMRLLKTNLTIDDVKPRLKEIVNLLFQRVPAGVGSSGFMKFTRDQFKEVVTEGSKWCVEKGYGWDEDLKRTEENGCMEGADTAAVSKRAIDRGITQIGTLGSGNHYLEIQVVKGENIFEKHIAKEFGLFPGQIVVMFHCGSRGFGHQIGTDYLELFLDVMEKKYGIKILDKELACAPFESKEGQDYYKAMKCAVNMSFANRQVILHRVRECFSQIFKKTPEEMEMHQIYDVAHNIAKIEKHDVNGTEKEVLVHRKGATRSFGPGREEIVEEYRHLGQPVIIGGSMETGSYLLLGTEKAMKETFGTTAHGSGRTMSRTRAKQLFRGDKLQKDMENRGIYVKTVSMSGLAEEAGAAYKDVDEVINATHDAGISKKVVKLVPIGNVKG